MAKKLWSCFFALIIGITCIATVSSPVQAAEKDFVVGKNNFHETGKYGKDGYFGPWFQDGCLTFESGVLVFDASVSDAWMTLNLTNDTLKATDYKYMVVKIKTNDPAQAENFAMTIGKKDASNGRKANNGKTFKDWTLADGSHPKPLTTQYSTVVVDLAKSGTTSFTGDPDFALNKGDAKNAKIYVSELYLTNTNPNGGAAAPVQTNTPSAAPSKTTASAAVSSAAPSSSSDSSSEVSSEAPVSSDTVSSDVVSASEASTAETVVSASAPASSSFNPAIIYIILAVVLAGGTVAAIIVISKKGKNKI